MSTDELINIIINKIGVKLPHYDYECRKFVCELPINSNISGKIIGTEQSHVFDTYNEACMFIYTWAVANSLLSSKLPTHAKRWDGL